MAGIRLVDVHVERELFTSRDYNLKRQMVDAARRRVSAPQVIKALSGVSLEIPEGAQLGLVGANGAGKSTLLAVVAGLLPPTRGRVEVSGRVLALLGGASAGLDLEASGRDNIITMGLQLGETPAAMRARIDEITEFSGLAKRILHAVHTYSSGMQARLRFSILTSLRPDVLVIDEGIGMADAEFSERAAERLVEFMSSAGILVMASHSEALISQHCNSAVWLDQGVVRDTGTVEAVLAGYRAMYHHDSEPKVSHPSKGGITAAEARSAAEPPPDSVVHILECSSYRGRLHVLGRLVWPEIAEIHIGTPPWSHVTQASISRPSDAEVHFDVEVALGHDDFSRAVLLVRTNDGEIFQIADLSGRALALDPVPGLFMTFQDRVRALTAPRVLEVGAHAESRYLTSWLPDDCRYVGFGDVAGPHVDVVGDPHRMSEILPRRYFDAALAFATFQHLAMPWVAAVELNRVLKDGGYVYAVAPQTWPVREGRGDFFRFSRQAWATLFNKRSGFEICDAVSSEPAKIVPTVAHAVIVGLENYPAHLNSAVLARKIGDTDLRWDARVEDVLDAE